MQRVTWKAVADLIGMGAIVASLIFVGLQMRQTHKIATADSYTALIAAQTEFWGLVAANAEVWAKGNDGHELDRGEAAAYESLVIAWNDSYYYAIQQDRTLHGEADVAVEINLADFAGFLFEHPRAREIWDARELRLAKYRDLLAPRGTRYSQYAEAIRANLARLDAAGL